MSSGKIWRVNREGAGGLWAKQDTEAVMIDFPHPGRDALAALPTRRARATRLRYSAAPPRRRRAPHRSGFLPRCSNFFLYHPAASPILSRASTDGPHKRRTPQSRGLASIVMSSDQPIGAPFTLATLSKPVGACHGRVHAASVCSISGIKKRKRTEIAVGLDGEGISIYSVSLT